MGYICLIVYKIHQIYPVGRLSTVLRGLLMLLLTVIFLISVNIVLGNPCNHKVQTRSVRENQPTSVDSLFSMIARMVRVLRLGARSNTNRSL